VLATASHANTRPPVSAEFSASGEDRDVSGGAATRRVGQDPLLPEERRPHEKGHALNPVEHQRGRLGLVAHHRQRRLRHRHIQQSSEWPKREQ